jgi:hypothetical protein
MCYGKRNSGSSTRICKHIWRQLKLSAYNFRLTKKEKTLTKNSLLCFASSFAVCLRINDNFIVDCLVTTGFQSNQQTILDTIPNSTDIDSTSLNIIILSATEVNRTNSLHHSSPTQVIPRFRSLLVLGLPCRSLYIVPVSMYHG